MKLKYSELVRIHSDDFPGFITLRQFPIFLCTVMIIIKLFSTGTDNSRVKSLMK